MIVDGRELGRGDLFVIVVDWERFQHRDAARAHVPTWIKTFTELLSAEPYLDLTGHRRAILHGLWLEYARTRRRLPDDTASLSRRLALKVTTRDLESLNHAGYIAFSASRDASMDASEHASLEQSREEKNSQQGRKERAHTPAAAPHPTSTSTTPPAELLTLLDELDVHGALRILAATDPARSIACARAALHRDGITNRGAYFRRLLETGETPTNARDSGAGTDPRARATPAPAERVAAMIRNGAIADPLDLEAEIRADAVDDLAAARLRAQLAELLEPAPEPTAEDGAA